MDLIQQLGFVIFTQLLQDELIFLIPFTEPLKSLKLTISK